MASRNDAVAYARATLSMPTPIVVGDSTNWVGVDTGSPFDALDPAAFPTLDSLDASAAGEVSSSLKVGGKTVQSTAVLPSDELDSSGDGEPVGYGVVGWSSLTGHVAAFDYQGLDFTLDPASPPPGLEAAVTFPFVIQGGGAVPNSPVRLPPTRVIVPVTVEGTAYTLLLDSGASFLAVSETVWRALTADGRPTTASSDMSALGSGSDTVTRARSVTVGGVERAGILASYDPDFASTALANASADVGQTIDGSLGGSFLAAFYLTVDYPNGQISLAKYTDESYLLDPAMRIGIVTTTTDGACVVAKVTGDATAKGVSVGDQITAIDGTAVASLGQLELDNLLLGALGTTKRVTFGTASKLTGQTVAVAVEDLLPLPPVAPHP